MISWAVALLLMVIGFPIACAIGICIIILIIRLVVSI